MDEPPSPSYFNLLIVDDSLAERYMAKKRVLEHLALEKPQAELVYNESRFADLGLELLYQNKTDLIIFDANLNPLWPDTISGLTEFFIPSRRLDYPHPIYPAICWADERYREKALRAGVEIFVPKPDDRGLIQAIYQALNPVLAAAR